VRTAITRLENDAHQYHEGDRPPRSLCCGKLLLQGFCAASIPFNEDGIAEFVGTIVVEVEFPVQATKSCVVHERAHQVVMAGAGLVCFRENCINHAKWRAGADPLRCQSKSWPHETIELSRMFQRPHNRRANRDNTGIRPWSCQAGAPKLAAGRETAC
jgi:hypothetical protein